MLSADYQQALHQATQRLKQLHLQRANLHNEQAQIHQHIQAIQQAVADPTPGGPPTSTSHADAVAIPTALAQAVPDDASDDNNNDKPHTFEVGEHVYIMNAISHVRLRRQSPRDRAAVVYNVGHDRNGQPRVSFTTYNGYRGWRAPVNLKRLRESERRRLGQPDTN